MRDFTYNSSDFLLDGKPYRIFSGAMHYFRIPREYWHDRLEKLKQCGFNTVETYTCWNLHEPSEGNFDFSGILDLGAYIDEAASLGLKVILRPGPYICSEWDFGGLPAWLLKYDDISFRCADPKYLFFVKRYFAELFQIIKPRFYKNGGNIIMLQIENEYGSYADDKVYLNEIRKMYHEFGADCLLFTSDGSGPAMLGGGTLPDELCVVNFGSRPEENFGYLKEFRPNQPIMCGEFWCGWFDHWGKDHVKRDPIECISSFKKMLDMGASVNFYMFHGGTSFGFMPGANWYDHYHPDVSSYDYGAPVSESGDLTKLYHVIRSTIAEFNGEELAPLTVADLPKKAYGIIEMNEISYLFANLHDCFSVNHSAAPMWMEDFGAEYGFALYHSVVDGPLQEVSLDFDKLHDRAVVFINGKFSGIKERGGKSDNIKLQLQPDESATIDILCENRGRVNYGPHMRDRKGLRGIRWDNRYHFGWDHFAIDINQYDKLHWTKFDGEVNEPVFMRGKLNITGEPCDTFIKVLDMLHGNIIVNGHNLGRYYPEAGPQQTLYCPAPFLKEGDNEIILFDSDGIKGNRIEFVDKPILE